MYPVFYQKVSGPIQHITGPDGKVSKYTSSALPIPGGSTLPPGGSHIEVERGIFCNLSLDQKPRVVNECMPIL